MSNFVDEGITFTDRFEKIDADLKAVKQALGIVILGLSGQPVNVGPDLMTSLGFKTSSIVPASVITKAS